MQYIKQSLLLLTLTIACRAPLYAGPLHDLVEKGNAKQVEQFLNDNKDVDINELDSNNDTPLQVACWNESLEIAKLLIKYGADVNKPGKNNDTPLRIACYNKSLGIVKLLIEHGADVNKPGKNNDTPLRIACYNESFKIVKLLIEHGANVNKIGRNYNNPFDTIKKMWSIEDQSKLITGSLPIKQKKSETELDTNTRIFIEFNAADHAELFNQSKTLVPFIIPDKKRKDLLQAPAFKGVKNKKFIISIGEELLNNLFFRFEKNKNVAFPLFIFEQSKKTLHPYIKQLKLQRDMQVLKNRNFKSFEDFEDRLNLLDFAHKCGIKRNKQQKNSVNKLEDVTVNFKNM
ncbi:MAG: hypothetical protein UV38_C0003G0018 [candidate division TM6 bacterium GW2011_GWE2_42_60]|nr:MAG: hypothetical protein UV38_C0003G0018 [candidate division TM6 bacterium GW2011_GWE2_42_60]HBY05925.1 hypothetical protein [Candidatus Dependentiae bacterium]